MHKFNPYDGEVESDGFSTAYMTKKPVTQILVDDNLDFSLVAAQNILNKRLTNLAEAMVEGDEANIFKANEKVFDILIGYFNELNDTSVQALKVVMTELTVPYWRGSNPDKNRQKAFIKRLNTLVLD